MDCRHVHSYLGESAHIVPLAWILFQLIFAYLSPDTPRILSLPCNLSLFWFSNFSSVNIQITWDEGRMRKRLRELLKCLFLGSVARDSDVASVVWGPEFYSFNKLSGASDAKDPQPHLEKLILGPFINLYHSLPCDLCYHVCTVFPIRLWVPRAKWCIQTKPDN